MSLPVIPASLEQYRDEILAGIIARERRASEYACAFGYPEKIAQPVKIDPPENNQPNQQTEPINPDPPVNTDPPVKTRFVTIWAKVGISAIQHNAGGAWRAWIFAKWLDTAGRGAILESSLIALLNELHVNPRKQRRWMSEARRLGLIRNRYQDDGWIVLASNQAGAVILGCNHVGAYRSSIQIEKIVAKGWRAYLWAAYESTHRERSISRETQLTLTGVPISTQRAYDNQAGVIRRANYAVSCAGADHLPGIRECQGRKSAFLFLDKRKDKIVTAWRTPDIRISPTESACVAHKGRSRKINQAIKRINHQQNNLSILGQVQPSAGDDTPSAGRLFHDTDKQINQTLRRLAKTDNAPRELYRLYHVGRRANLWDVINP